MKITGVLPVHNSERFIDISLPLILGNLKFDDQLVIVNNGSSDNSSEKLEKWLHLD